MPASKELPMSIASTIYRQAAGSSTSVGIRTTWASGFSRYQPQSAGSLGRSNQPVPSLTRQGSGLHRYLAAGVRWKGKAGLSATPKSPVRAGPAGARPAGAATSGRVFATRGTQLQTFAIEGTLVSSAAVICCHLLSCHRRARVRVQL
eukprot:COSAG06_NODE_3430_length_5356_cov_9.963287_4_plen_148_part_00